MDLLTQTINVIAFSGVITGMTFIILDLLVILISRLFKTIKNLFYKK